MKAKYLLTALAMPALFAACSQDEFADYGQVQNGTALGTVAGDVAFTINEETSRLAWGPTGAAAWETTDDFSLYWINGEGEADLATQFPGKSNAVYYVNNDGDFTSQSVVYEGQHVIVFPANKKHLSDDNIVVSVDSVQKNTTKLGDRSVFASEVLTIMAPKASGTYKGDTIAAAGYDYPVPATVKPLSSNLVLNLNFNLGSKISEVEVQEVTLEAPAKVFATKANLIYKAADSSLVKIDPTEFSKSLTLKVENEKVNSSKTQYVAQLAFMADSTAVAGLTNEGYSIKVKTNYGVVSVDSAMLVKNSKNTMYICGPDTVAGKGVVGDSKLNLTPELKYATQFNPTSHRNATVELEAAEQGYGKRITLNVAVDMSKASIMDMEVATSAELVAAYNTYTLLEKKDSVNFVLAPEFAQNFQGIKAFDLDTEALKSIQANNKVTLTLKKGNTAIRLDGAHTAIPTLPVKFAPSANTGDATTEMTAAAFAIVYADGADLILGSDATAWAIDVNNAKILNGWNSVINEGTLTLTQGTTGKTEQVLSKALTNNGTVNVATKVSLPVNYVQAGATAATNVTANTFTLKGAANEFKNGTVKIDGKIIADGSAARVLVDTIANITVNGSLLQSNSAQITNAGTVTLGENGAVIIEDNEYTYSGAGITNPHKIGSIVLNKRTNSVTTSSNDGYIKLNYTDAKFKTESSDAFNYLIISSDLDLSGEDSTTVVKHIEVDGNLSIKTKSTGFSLGTVIVNANKTLRIPTGSSITATATVKNGDIEVYGDYTAGAESGSGTIYRIQ